MSKINNLLKKASFFEKLAIFGDRKNFLKSIAQAAPKVKTISDMGDPELSPALPFDESDKAKYWRAALEDPSQMKGEDLPTVPTSFPATTEYTTPANPAVKAMQMALIQLADTLKRKKENNLLGGVKITDQEINRLKNIGQNAKSQEDGFWGTLTSQALDLADDITLRLDSAVLYDFIFDKTRNAKSAIQNARVLSELMNYFNSQEFTKHQLGKAIEETSSEMNKRTKELGKIQEPPKGKALYFYDGKVQETPPAAQSTSEEFDSAFMPDSI